MNDIYFLSKERFIYYENKYGYLKDNHLNMIKILLFCFIYIDNKDCKDIINKIRSVTNG